MYILIIIAIVVGSLSSSGRQIGLMTLRSFVELSAGTCRTTPPRKRTETLPQKAHFLCRITINWMISTVEVSKVGQMCNCIVAFLALF